VPGERFSRRCAALIVDVELDGMPDWERGPLPFRKGETVATAEVRRSYFNERTAQALHGPNRVHRWTSDGGVEPLQGGFEVVGLELLRVHERSKSRNALLVVHGDLDSDGLSVVDSLASLAPIGETGSKSRGWYDELLAGFGRVEQNVRRAATVSLVTPAGDLPDASLTSAEYDGWAPELKWLWLLASASPAEVYRPPPDYAERLDRSLVRLSADWLALVLRDGAAFLGAGADIGAFYRLAPDAELHFRSIYLDALLLGHVQRLMLSRIADDLATLGDPVVYPERLVTLERELTEFRNVFWWQQLGPHWHGNELLQAYQRQHEIPALFEEVMGGLDDYSGQTRTAAAQRTSALLGILSIVGLPSGFALALLRALGIEDWRWILASLLIAAAVTVAILATRPGRTLVRPLVVRRRVRAG
jgi:hypothetical protein